MTSDAHLIVEISSGVLRLTINRPEKLNALTPDIYRRIGDATLAAQDDDAVQVITIRGAGRAFSAGFDLNLEVSDTSHSARLDGLQKVSNRARWAIWNSAKPVVAAIHGYCLAGAFELMMPCDLTIAAKSTILGEPEILFGSGPAFMMVPWFTGHKQAKDLLLLGRNFSAEEALRMGFVSSVVEDDALDAALEDTVRTLLRMSPRALGSIKSGINRAYEGAGLKPHLDAWTESGAYLSFVTKEEGSMFKDILEAEGVGAALEWRRKHFAGAARETAE